MPVIPWMVNSRRKFSGRFFMTMNGASIGPIFIFPVNFIDCRAFSLSRPPLALMFLSMSSSAVCADADTASNAAAQSESTSFLCMGNPSFEVGRIEIFSYVRRGREVSSQLSLFDLLPLTVVALASASSAGFVRRRIAVSFSSLSGCMTTSFCTRLPSTP